MRTEDTKTQQQGLPIYKRLGNHHSQLTTRKKKRKLKINSFT
jgi:hypothetical protein